ncbi:single-stranded DNA-binding protein [bacterium]|nr:single-stranded DNA-binding protein [candidate division CSSED10-310 bacterium]
MNLMDITDRLVQEVAALTFGNPVAHVYNPLRYAREPYDEYCLRYGRSPKRIVMVGMNPGPWGMVQTGVPFGDVDSVRGWLGIQGSVVIPPDQHPRRPILGFKCPRSEVSGRRVWGWARDRFGTPDRFFSTCFVANYCPLAFLEESGRNRTPDKLPKWEREPLFAVCDRALAATVAWLGAGLVLGFGAFAEARCRVALRDLPVRACGMAHPSPANPRANRGWSELADKALADLMDCLPTE